MKHPIYVDGPLKGKDVPVEDGCARICAAAPVPVANPRLRYDNGWIPDIVTYHIFLAAVHVDGESVTVWIGTCSGAYPRDQIDEMVVPAVRAWRSRYRDGELLFFRKRARS